MFGVREIVLSAVLIGGAAATVCNEPSLGRKRRFVSWSGRNNRVQTRLKAGPGARAARAWPL